MTEEEYQEIMKASEEIGESASSYCVRAINKSLGKVEKIEPKNFNFQTTIDIYHEDFKTGVESCSGISRKLRRLVDTLEQRESCAEFEFQRLCEIANELDLNQKEFIRIMEEILKERNKVRDAALRSINKKVDKLLKE